MKMMDSVVARYWKDRSIALPYKEAPVAPEPEVEEPLQQVTAGALPEDDQLPKDIAGADAHPCPPEIAEGASSKALQMTVEEVASDQSPQAKSQPRPEPTGVVETSAVMHDAQVRSRSAADGEAPGDANPIHVSSAKERAGSPHVASPRRPKCSVPPAKSAEVNSGPDAAGVTQGGADAAPARAMSTPLGSEPGPSTRQAEKSLKADAVASLMAIGALDGHEAPFPGPSGGPTHEVVSSVKPVSKAPSQQGDGLLLPGQGPVLPTDTAVEPIPQAAGDQQLASIDGASVRGSEFPGATVQEGGSAQPPIGAEPRAGSATEGAVEGETVPAGSVGKGDMTEDKRDEGAKFMYSRLRNGDRRGSAAAKVMEANLLARAGGLGKGKGRPLKNGKDQALESDGSVNASIVSLKARTVPTRKSGRLAQLGGSCASQGPGACESCGIEDPKHVRFCRDLPGGSPPRASESRTGESVPGQQKKAVSPSRAAQGAAIPGPLALLGAPACELGQEGVAPQGSGVLQEGQAQGAALLTCIGNTASECEEVVDIEESPPHSPVLLLREARVKMNAARRQSKKNGKHAGGVLSPGSELYQAQTVHRMLQFPGKDEALLVDTVADTFPAGEVRFDEIFHSFLRRACSCAFTGCGTGGASSCFWETWG